MNWELIEDNWKQIKASVKQNRGKFNDDSLDDIDNYSDHPRNSIKQWHVKVPSELSAVDQLSKPNKSHSRKKL
jgi:hypothetical protein